MQRIAELVDVYRGTTSVFVEALEFEAMETAGVGDVSAVRRQIAALAQNGHEINLHLHPQWLRADFAEDRTWQLSGPSWRTGDLDQATSIESVRRGAEWVRDVLASVSPDHRCIAFRAGGWAIQPSEVVTDALRECGFAVESSVAPSMVCTLPTAWFDFRGAPDLAYWNITGDVLSVGHGPLLEVPIAVGRVSPVRHLLALASRKKRGEFAPDCQGSYAGRSDRLSRLRTIISRLQSSGRAMLDICALPAPLMIQVVENWIKRHGDESGVLPIVAIGHTKNFSHAAESELAKFLEWTKGQSNLRISSYADWLTASRTGPDSAP